MKTNGSNHGRFPGWVFVFVLAGGFLLLLTSGMVSAQDLPPSQFGTVSIQNEVLERLQAENSADFILVMDEQADLSAAYDMGWEERGWYVYNTLQEAAQRSQAAVRAELDAAGVRYESFIAGNEIYVYGGDRALLSRVLRAGEIREVRAPLHIQLAGRGFGLTQPGPQPIPNHLWDKYADGIFEIGASSIHYEYGLAGEGVRVANIDSGVKYNHPALIDSYACAHANPIQPRCWYDPTGICAAGVPCDDDGHGTHTMGTMVGSHNPSLEYYVGVAPRAQWIACKGCTQNGCESVDLAACADWLLAPGGDPGNRPHVVNNSWGGKGGDLWFAGKVAAWRASGIFPVFAAGNSGPACSSLSSPADYPGSFAVGAMSDHASLSYFSSRGPADPKVGAQPYLKPNLTAPGSEVLSAFPSELPPYGDWVTGTGTSMAAPHAAGAVALIWSCAPSLRGDLQTTFELLQSAALPYWTYQDCGAPPGAASGNYSTGYGKLSAIGAAAPVCKTNTVHGKVLFQVSGEPVRYSQVVVTWLGSPRQSARVYDDGWYEIRVGVLDGARYRISAFYPGYCSAPQEFQFTSSDPLRLDIYMDECPNTLFLPAVTR